MNSGFGLALKDWRGRRRMSQLHLSGEANVSARHIAFLETGRARPSRSMVLLLSEALKVPRVERNSLLQAAGFAPAYRARALGEVDMGAIRAAVEWTLSRHEPYPGLAFDRHWRIVLCNRPGASLMSGAGLKLGDSLIDALVEDGQLWAMIENQSEAAQHFAARLRTESAHLGGDSVLQSGAAKLLARIGSSGAESYVALPPVVPLRLNMGEATFSFFSTIAQFGTAEDIALADLRIELFFPADYATRAILTAQVPVEKENGPV